MSDWSPVYWSLGLALGIGLLMQLVIADFAEDREWNQNSTLFYVAEAIDRGYEINLTVDLPFFGNVGPTYYFHPFGYLPNETKTELANQVGYMTFIPNKLLWILHVIIGLGFAVFLIKVVRGI